MIAFTLHAARKYCFLLFFFHLMMPECTAQENSSGKGNYPLTISFTDKDSLFKPQALRLQTSFLNEADARAYIDGIPGLLHSKGFPAASVDSMNVTGEKAFVLIYLGRNFQKMEIDISTVDAEAISGSGFFRKGAQTGEVDMNLLKPLQQRILRYYENNGYPFASVYLDSVLIAVDKMKGSLKVAKSVLYHIDSIRVFGNARISNRFLQRYLFISNGSVYSREKLEKVDQLITELPFLNPVQPSDITMLGSGSILNLYLQPKKSSRVNFLVGLMPEASGSNKLLFTGDVNLDLKNLLNSGESILVKWQQLQKKSPRLNLGYNQPYIFHSPFGSDFLFNLFKKDSTFLQVSARLGVDYAFSVFQKGRLFIQWENNSLLEGGVDTNLVIARKQLPDDIDVNSVSVGLNYEWNRTNYRFNPRSGNEVNLLASVGIKHIKINNDIASIKDPAFNYSSLYDAIRLRNYQMRLEGTGAHYFPTGRAAVLKAALNTGVFISPDIFRNELFRIGGYRLLRGFDEESIYASSYVTATMEYRYLINLNSYLAGFIDAAAVKSRYQDVDISNRYIGAGLGIVYETRIGLLNVSYAVGKRDDVKFNIRESSKLHFGYINYF